MSASSTKARSGEEEAVRQVMNGYQEAWNRHDPDAFAALFAPDADFVNVAGTHWKGREAIRVNHAFTHGTVPMDSEGVTHPKELYGVFRTVTIAFTQINLRFLREDVAVAHVHSESRGYAHTNKSRHALPVMILTKEGGRWHIAVAQNTYIRSSA